MSIHGSERWSNVKASVFAYVMALQISGSPPWVVEGQPRAQAQEGPWARLGLRPVDETMAGEWSTTARASRVDFLIVVDLFWPDGSTAQVVNTYALDKAADDLIHSLRYADIPMKDYAADAENPSTLTGHAIRLMELPIRSERQAAEGFHRVQILADAYHHIQHAS